MGFSSLQAARRYPQLPGHSTHLILPTTALAVPAVCPAYSRPMADWDFGCSWIPIEAFLHKGGGSVVL